MMGIANGIPEFGVYPTEGDLITGKRLWKVIDPLMTAMVENEIDYTIEGVQLIPSYVSQFAQIHAGKVKPCFIGLADIDAESSVESMKLYSSQTENDGLKKLNHTEMIHEITRIKTDSQQIKEECEKYNLKYVDSYTDFTQSIDLLVTYLLSHTKV